MAASEQRGCFFWDCDLPIPKTHFLCAKHYKEYRDGLLDKCLQCNRWKPEEHAFCEECEEDWEDLDLKDVRGHSNPWESSDADAMGFFVYILKLTGGGFYAGQTRELRERLSEHRDGRVKTTAGKDPKLVWFTVVPTREEALDTESHIRRICSNNPREIRRWVVELKSLISEFDFS